MIETSELHYKETTEIISSVQPFYHEQDAGTQRIPGRIQWFRQVLRFGLAGGLNTLVDLLLGMRLWVFVSKAQKEQKHTIPDIKSELPTGN